jgi:hypothetical protein
VYRLGIEPIDLDVEIIGTRVRINERRSHLTVFADLCRSLVLPGRYKFIAKKFIQRVGFYLARRLHGLSLLYAEWPHTHVFFFFGDSKGAADYYKCRKRLQDHLEQCLPWGLKCCSFALRVPLSGKGIIRSFIRLTLGRLLVESWLTVGRLLGNGPFIR